jgi:hypothetical protein
MDSDKEKLLAEIEMKVTTSCNWWMVNQQTLTSELARWIVDQVASIPFFAAPSPAQAVGGEPDYKAAWDGLQKRLTNHCRGDLHRDIPVDDLWNWIAGLEMDYLAPRSAPEAGEGERPAITAQEFEELLRKWYAPDAETAPAPKTE